MPDRAPLPAFPMPRGVLHASMISASTMCLPQVYRLAAFAADHVALSIRSRPICRPDGAEWNPGFIRYPTPDIASLIRATKISLPPPQRQYLFRRAQRRLVVHLAIHLHDT